MKLATAATPILITSKSSICLGPKLSIVISIPAFFLNIPLIIAVATPVPKTAQTDTVIKPDMKRPATSPVIKNVEVKAGKETVRTNIRQEQQVKGVTRTNQPNVVESRSNQKKTTIQKQVNQKQNRKTVTKQPEKGRKK